MTKCSLTPSVVLQCDVPGSVDKSFVRGKVTTINDSVFLGSSPLRHAAMLSKIIEQAEVPPKVILKYADGGTDQRNNI